MNLATSVAFKNIRIDNMSVVVEGETLKKCQKVILSIAEDVISVCEQEGIWYELGGGTALGAVRHGGFIPWDDDIDLNILGKDLELLRKKITEYYGDKYTFLDYSVPDYGLPMGRVMLKDGVYRDRESIGSDNCGFFVDLFFIENVPDCKALRKIHGIACTISGGLLSCRKFYKNRALMETIIRCIPEVESAVKTKVSIGRMISFLSLACWAKFSDWLYGLCKNDSSEYVTIPSGRKHYFDGITERHKVIKTAPQLFEGHQWQVAADYDSYLKRLYGNNYMAIPEEEEREHHILFELKFPREKETKEQSGE